MDFSFPEHFLVKTNDARDQIMHAGANPLESILKILSFLTFMDPNFLIKINLEAF